MTVRGIFVALKTTMFPDSDDAVGIFAAGLKIRDGSGFSGGGILRQGR